MSGGEGLNDRLLRLYEPLVERTVEACGRGEWPANAAVGRGFRRAEGGRLEPARFDDGQGPVGVTAVCPELVRAAAAARSAVFEPLVRRLDAVLAEHGAGPLSVWWAPDAALHFTIFQFTEHPSLMPEDVRDRCVPLSGEDDRILCAAVAERVSRLDAPTVTLHGLRLMPDGSMLLLFLEAPGALGAVGALRCSCAAAAAAAGQDGQPVRPKDFLHVVVGRVLEVGPLSEEARGSLARSAASEAEPVARLGVGLVAREGAEVEWCLPVVDLVRTWQWLHMEHTNLGSYILSPPAL